MRNLDLTALRSFVAIADSGGVTRAAGLLNLTQSAVSMQIKRLEESLDLKLLDRVGRQVALSPSGEQLISYARRMVDLNDEVLTRLADKAYEGEIRLGVPHDIVYPVIPRVLQQFRAQFPRMQIHLQASFSHLLKEELSQGGYDLILTTEPEIDHGGETLAETQLSWTGAENGSAWRQTPLRLGFSRHCKFRPLVQRALDQAGMKWEMAVESDSDRTIEATIGADLAICAVIEGTEPPHLVPIIHGGQLPVLPKTRINLYGAHTAQTAVVRSLAEMLRQGFADLKLGRSSPSLEVVPRAG